MPAYCGTELLNLYTGKMTRRVIYHAWKIICLLRKKSQTILKAVQELGRQLKNLFMIF